MHSKFKTKFNQNCVQYVGNEKMVNYKSPVRPGWDSGLIGSGWQTLLIVNPNSIGRPCIKGSCGRSVTTKNRVNRGRGSTDRVMEIVIQTQGSRQVSPDGRVNRDISEPRKSEDRQVTFRTFKKKKKQNQQSQNIKNNQIRRFRQKEWIIEKFKYLWKKAEKI